MLAVFAVLAGAQRSGLSRVSVVLPWGESSVICPQRDRTPVEGRFRTWVSVQSRYPVQTAPVDGRNRCFLPAVALSTSTIASFTRIGRSAMLDVLQSDYIRTAKSKGLKGTTVILIHALRNAMIPLLTQLGTSFGVLLGGAIITEQVFVINGIGTYLIDAIRKYNYPVVQSTVLIIATMFILVNLIVDLVYCVVDPRIKYE